MIRNCRRTWWLQFAGWLCLFLPGTRLVADDTNSDWPRFRGPNGQGASTGKGLPVTWGDKANVVWKTELPGAGTSSPILVGPRIFLTCYSGYGVPGRPRGDMDQLKL